jgi:hypothetical protein
MRVGVNDGYTYIVVVMKLTEYEFSPTIDDPVEMIFGE